MEGWIDKLGIKHFRSIYSIDALPDKIYKKEGGIINLDDIEGPGTHWICCRNLERYEDVVFDLEQPLDINPNDGLYQKREVMKIVADNTGETTPFDWYNSSLSIDFKVDKLVAMQHLLSQTTMEL